MRKGFFSICLAVVGFITMVPCQQSSAQSSERALRVNGAGMACDQVQIWANELTAANPNIRVLVYGSSAGKGLETLIGGEAEIALTSRVISPDEQKKAAARGLRLANRLIGYSGMAVVTNARNPVNELTMEQLRQIFTGEYSNWKQVGGPDAPIRCLTRKIPESGGAMFFMEEVLHNQSYGSATVFADSWTSIIKICSVANDLPVGIGPAIIAGKSGVKVLGVKQDQNAPAVMPNEETLRDRSYPIINPIRMYWDSQTQDERIKRFTDFCAGKGLPKK